MEAAPDKQTETAVTTTKADDSTAPASQPASEDSSTPATPPATTEGKPTPAGEAEAPKTETLLADLDPALKQVAARGKIGEGQLAALGEGAMDFLLTLKAGQDAVSAELGRLGRANRESPDSTPAGREEGATRTTTPKVPPVEDKSDPLAEMGIEIDPDKYDEDVRGAFTKIASRLRQREKQMDALLAHYEQQEVAEFMDTADRFIAGLGAKYAGIYGDGKTAAMDPKTMPDGKARLALFEEAQAIRAGATLQERKMDVEEALLAAHSILHKEDIAKIAREGYASQRSARDGQVLEKPTNRTDNQPTGVEKSRQTEADYARKHGLRK